MRQTSAARQQVPQATGRATPEPPRSNIIALLIAGFSAFLALVSLYFSLQQEASTDLRNATRDWQRGVIFSILLAADKPLSIAELQSKYKGDALAFAKA